MRSRPSGSLAWAETAPSPSSPHVYVAAAGMSSARRGAKLPTWSAVGVLMYIVLTVTGGSASRGTSGATTDSRHPPSTAATARRRTSGRARSMASGSGFVAEEGYSSVGSAARGHRSALGHGRRPRSPTFPAVCILAHPSAPTPMRRLLLFILPFLAASALAQAPAVASVTPANGRTLVALDTPVTVAFDRAVDPASVTPATFRVFG